MNKEKDMGLKNVLRNWLEVPGETPNISNAQIGEAMQEFIGAVFSEYKEDSYTYYENKQILHLNQGLHSHLDMWLRRNILSEVKKTIKQQIEPEAFIDEVVKRILAKQIWKS